MKPKEEERDMHFLFSLRGLGLATKGKKESGQALAHSRIEPFWLPNSLNTQDAELLQVLIPTRILLRVGISIRIHGDTAKRLPQLFSRGPACLG